MTIEHPNENGTVAIQDDVHTRVNGAPDRQVWILVQYASDARVYPQGPCDNIDSELTICRGAQFGDKTDHAGTGFKVTTVDVDPSDASIYQKYYTTGFPASAPPVKPIASSQTILVRRG